MNNMSIYQCWLSYCIWLKFYNDLYLLFLLTIMIAIVIVIIIIIILRIFIILPFRIQLYIPIVAGWWLTYPSEK